jgi:hypothetical protein
MFGDVILLESRRSFLNRLATVSKDRTAPQGPGETLCLFDQRDLVRPELPLG